MHLGCTREEQLRWLSESWEGACAARSRGADVRAVTAWGLLGSYNWHSLVTRDDEHYEPGVFDVRAPAPRPTALARAIRSIAASEAVSHPVLATRGWWRRPTRLLHASRRPASPVRDKPAVLVIGSRGALGSALERICSLRGLACEFVDDVDADHVDQSSLAAAVRNHAPWAVIDAGRAMPLDVAQTNADTCFRLNVLRPAALAAVCAARGLSFVTFSSDLVFDGHERQPYVEDHPPGPLNVYGACKLQAERRVLDILPAALIVRTSAPFGPWDDETFLGEMLRALDRGEAVQAPAEHLMSPTYLPDLVHATLDLLIDGEHGIWHVANEGAVTWFDLARDAARRTKRPVDGIVPQRISRVFRAPRPRFSALSSCKARLVRSLDAALDAFSREWTPMRPDAGREPCASR